MRHNVIRVGWGLVALGVGVLAVVVPAGALQASGDAAFNRWVGWATVWALVIAAVGVLPVVWDKVVADGIHVEASAVEDQLAKAVLFETADLRRQLIALGAVSDKPANVRFAKIHGPAKIHGRFREVGGFRGGDLQSILPYYRSLPSARLVILGEPGAGKTVLAIELQICLLEERQHDPALPIPVLISAAAYDARQGWSQWLAAHLAKLFTISTVTAAELIRDGRILPVLDGLDEMDTSEGTDTAEVAPARTESDPARGAAGVGTARPARAAKLVSELNRSFRGRNHTPVVITCRPGEYEKLGRGIDGAAYIKLVPLDGDESSDYLEGQFGDEDEARRWAPVVKALRADPAGPLAARLGTPWRLTLALGAFCDGGEPGALLLPGPDRPSEAPDGTLTAVDRLLLGQYIEGAVRRGKMTRYRATDVQRWLSALADGLAWQARHAKSATDIELAAWWEPSGRRTTQLVHSALLLLSPAVAVAWLFDAWSSGGGLNQLGGVSVGGVGGGAACLLLIGTLAVRPPSPRRLGARQLITWRGARRFARGLILGFFLGLMLALLLTAGIAGYPHGSGWPGDPYIYQYFQRIEAGMWMRGPVCGGVLAGVAGLAVGLADPAPSLVGPPDVIKADARYLLSVVVALTILLGPVLGLFSGLSVALSDADGTTGTPVWQAVSEALTWGAGGGLLLGLWIGAAGAGGRGSSAWTRYRITVLVNWLRRRAPLRFGAFLDWSHEVGLLRVSGVAYQFRHRQLQDWLATRK